MACTCDLSSLTIAAPASSRLSDPSKWACDECGSTDGLWVCTGCGHVGCGREASGHARAHAQHHRAVGHAAHDVCVDAVTKAAHCFSCDDYVISDPPWLARCRSQIERAESEPSAAIVDVAPEAPRAAAAPRTGLKNLGNTCYMNSVVQLLVHCDAFRGFFLDFIKQQAPLALGPVGIKREATITWKASAEEKKKPSELALATAVHGILRVLASGRWSSCAPHALVQAVWTHRGCQFANRRQNDAQEFLFFLIDRLSEELRADAAAGGSGGGSGSSGSGGLLDDFFGLEVVQEVKCGSCGAVSRRTELGGAGLLVSLPEPPAGGGTLKTSPAVALDACVDTALPAAEPLDGFACDKCGARCRASVSRRLGALPRALLLSIARTRYDMKKGRHKDARMVRFPLELDVAKWRVEGEAKAAAEGEAAPDGKYVLRAVLVHSGRSTDQGHYYSFARGAFVDGIGDGGWVELNDERVKAAEEGKVLGAEAFVLLYEEAAAAAAGGPAAAAPAVVEAEPKRRRRS